MELQDFFTEIPEKEYYWLLKSSRGNEEKSYGTRDRAVEQCERLSGTNDSQVMIWIELDYRHRCAGKPYILAVRLPGEFDWWYYPGTSYNDEY